MSLPVDLPNPNQENVFYTIPALKAELLNWFSSEKIDAIKDKYSDYFLPTFVFDPAGAPLIYNLDVYPKNGSKESLQLDQNGNIIDELGIPEPVVKTPDVEYLIDGGFTCSLDPKFYVDTLLKEPNDITFEIENALETLDLLVATKYYKDESLSEKVQNFAILKNLLLGQLKILPEDELKVFKEEYESVLKTIELYLKSLDDVADGQSKSLDALKFESFYNDVYQQVNTLRSSQRGLGGTQMIMGQALADLGNVFQKDGESYRIHKGTDRNDSSSSSVVIAGPYSTQRPNKWGHVIWPSLIDVLTADGLIQRETDLVPRSGSLSNLGEDFDAVTKFQDVPVFSKDGKPSEWYYDNLKKSVSGEDPDWTSLETFIETMKNTIDPYIQNATLETLGGQHLLVDQAIMKAILKLCLTNLDVSEYATKDKDGNSFFSTIGRSPSLGPAGTSPWPSKYIIDPEEYQVRPYTNNSFLCYHALIALVGRFGSDTDELSFLVENIKEPDSDHDKIIGVVKAASYAGEGVNRYVQEPYRSATEGTKPKRDLNELMHLYTRGTAFPIFDDVILLPKQDGIPMAERSFLGWNIPSSEHTTEHCVRTTITDETNYSLLRDDHSSSVLSGGYGSSNGGKLKYDSLPDEYLDMGYLGASPDAIHNMRLFKVNYGVGYEWANNNETIRKKNVLHFFKQRRYSTPYFWASMTSLWRALALESWKNMIESINDIQETDIKLTNQEILDKFDHTLLWKRIKQIFVDLKNDSELSFYPFVSGDGTISFSEAGDNAFDFAQDTQNANTPGYSTRTMMKEYVRFVSLVSDFKSVQIKETHTPIEFDSDTYLPPEGLTINTNINFSNSHGGSGQYLEPTFDEYYDKLVYTKGELSKGELIKKHILPVSGDVPTNFTTRYSIFLGRAKGLYRHIEMFEHIMASLGEIKTFVGGFSVPNRIQEAINDGRIDLSSDLDDPTGLIDQIGIYKEKYKANENGLGNRWDWSLSPEDINSRAERERWLYVHVLGLKRSCFEGEDFVILQPEYITADSVVEIPDAAIRVGKFESRSPFDNDSELFMRWLHMSAGLDVCELTFSKNNEMIYSDSLIKSESEVFPWKKDDFDEGAPKKPLETIYNMSPWLFSDNMFNDICVPNEYHRVVACVITKTHLESSGIGLELLDGKIDDIIGSIRWKKI